MTDLNKTKNLFSELGLGFRETQWDENLVLELRVEPGREKITGYSCFCADFKFDKEGKFLEVVITE